MMFKEERIGKTVGCNWRDNIDFCSFAEVMDIIDLPSVGEDSHGLVVAALI